MLISCFEYLTYVCTVMIGEILSTSKRFVSEDEDKVFRELFALYSTNPSLMKEFALSFTTRFIFADTDSQDEQLPLRKQEFYKKMQEINFVALKPYEFRKKYTEFVIQNHHRALLPRKRPQ